MDNRWNDAKIIIERLEADGHKAYFVGGCVRDRLMGRPVKDIDLTTSALPVEVMDLFKNVIPTGIEHGTVLVRYKQQSFEVTTFRSEGTYSDKRRPDAVEFIPDIREDLARRDFTMNAMAMDKQHEIIDLFDGRADIEAKQINTVGEAKERFQEDALRIMRALRFASQLGFTIETKTYSDMYQLKDEVLDVAVERIKEESEKFFQGEFIKSGLSLLRSTEIYLVLPIFRTHPRLLDEMPDISIPFATFADVIAFFHYLKPNVSIQAWIKEWKCSNKEKRRSKSLVAHLISYEKRGLDDWLAYQIEPDYIASFCHLTNVLFPDKSVTVQTLRTKKQSLPVQRREHIEMDGHFVSSLFPDCQKGPWIREIMEEVEYLVVTDQLENKQTIIKEWVICHPPGRN